MPEVMLKDGTPVTVQMATDQPALVEPWDDTIRYRVAFNGDLIGFVESWRQRVGNRFPKRWVESLSYGMLQLSGVKEPAFGDMGRFRYHKTRKAALERLVDRYTKLRRRIGQ